MSPRQKVEECWDCGREPTWRVVRPRATSDGQKVLLSCGRHLNLAAYALTVEGPAGVHMELMVSRASNAFHQAVAVPFTEAGGEDPRDHTGSNDHQSTGVHDRVDTPSPERDLTVAQAVSQNVARRR